MKKPLLAVSTLCALAVGALVSASCGSNDTNANPADTGTASDATSDAQTETAETTNETASDVVDDGAPSTARGEYLVKHLLICGDCHTTPDATGAASTNPADFLAGGRDFPIPGEAGVGHVYSRNLTPDATNGIGAWTIDQIKRAVSKGLDDGGAPLFPIMPYSMFGNLTDGDLTSIALYLKSLPPSTNKVPEPTVHVPAAAPVYPQASIPHTTLDATNPNFPAAERGRYLAEVSCIECHTQDAPTGGLDFAKSFAGGKTFFLGPITSVSDNITPDPSGIGTWSPVEIVTALQTDKERGTDRPLCPPMPGGPGRLGDLSAADLFDLSIYVHTLPPVVNTVSCASAGCCNASGDAGTDAPVGD